MALIKCVECGKEVSDKAPYCPNCGCPMSPIIENANETIPQKDLIEQSESEILQDKETNNSAEKVSDQEQECAEKQSILKSKKFLVGCVLVLIAIIGFVCMPSQNEKRAVAAAKELQSMLKDPSSMIIRGNILVGEDYVSDVKDGYYVIINYGAANAYGGIVSDRAYFCELGYIGDSDTEVNDITNSTKKDRFMLAGVYEIFWDSYGDVSMNNPEEEKVEAVSGKYVAKKIGCAFYE